MAFQSWCTLGLQAALSCRDTTVHIVPRRWRR